MLSARRDNGAEASQYRILLGGIGGDAHSVGLTILRQALSNAGYQLEYLGIQNRLADFFALAEFVDLVMISSMDGHARHYLRDMPELLRDRREPQPLWYLGGNVPGSVDDVTSHFHGIGFRRVFLRQIDLQAILETIAEDLRGARRMGRIPWLRSPQAVNAGRLRPDPVDERLDPDEFASQRSQVLGHWPTGAGACDLEASAEFLRRQPSFTALQAAVLAGRSPILIQPRCGVALEVDQIELFRAFARVGLRALSYQVDSLTRNNNYTGAAEEIRVSRAAGVSTLNGFPVVNHGVPALRRITAETGVALQVRHSTRDPRLLAEISYAGGVTSVEGGAVCYNIPYYKDYPVADSVYNWKYVDYLTGLFHRRFGLVLDREFFGPLTATLIPPSLAIAVTLSEAILAIQQGVKSVSLGYAEQGNRVQDVAAIRALRRLATEWIFTRLGYRDVQVSTVFHQYMAAFPTSVPRADELIRESAVSAALSGATRVIIKTRGEASGIPSLSDNLAAVRTVTQAIAQARGCSLDETRIAAEEALIAREVESLLTGILAAGHGSLASGVVAAFRRGLLDIPFAPSRYNRGEVITARDAEGAVRYLRIGRLPLDGDVRQFHDDRLQERAGRDRLSLERDVAEIVYRDVTRIPRGEYAGWPLTEW